MTDSKRKIVEIIIGSLLVIFGCVIFYEASIGFLFVYNKVGVSWEEISLLKVLYNYNFIASIVLFVSGILLMMRKKNGWIGSIIMSFFSAILLLINLFGRFVKGYEYVSTDSSYLIFYGVLIILFLAIGGMLLHKSFIKKYQPTKGIWILMLLFIIVLSVNEAFVKPIT